jgi:hypothetical protein
MAGSLLEQILLGQCQGMRNAPAQSCRVQKIHVIRLLQQERSSR